LTCGTIVAILLIKGKGIKPKKTKEETTMKSNKEIPPLEELNANDDPKSFGGECLGDDGQGNELWLFRSVDKLANRFEDDDVIRWDGDIEGWNYTEEYALD